MAADASTRRTLSASPSSATPAMAASTGTASCSVAAVVARNAGSAVPSWSVHFQVGDTLALQSIGAAVIAGVSLHGGVGRVQWVALGSLFLLLSPFR